MNLRDVLKSAPKEVCEAAMKDAKQIVELAHMDARLEILRRERDENLRAFNHPEKQGLPPLWLLLLFAIFSVGVAYGLFLLIMTGAVNMGGN